MPTNHGFDEFFGNLYHLNAEEEPEHPDYPKEAWFKKRFGPRGVIHSYADGRIEDTGPLTKKRMETVDEEFLQASLGFIDKAHQADKPFFLWFNSTRMHVWTHLSEKWEGKTGQGVYADGMAEHDHHVGVLLDKLDQLGIADNTIVVYSTDNGAEVFSWPDGGTIPFRGEKNTTWEGGFRVPAMVRWPGKIKPHSVSNGILSHQDWLPTLMTAAGEKNIVSKLKKGHQAGDKKFQVHLDGFDQMEHLQGHSDSKRHQFFYFTDDGNLSAVRMDDWKVVFSEQRAHGLDVWAEPYTPLRLPKVFNLRRDPFERADVESCCYDEFRATSLPYLYKSQVVVGQFLQTFKQFPPRQRPASFSIDQIVNQFMNYESLR